MEEINWLRVTVDFITKLDAIGDKKSTEVFIETLAVLHAQSRAKKSILIEKLDKLTVKIIYCIPEIDDFDSFEPDFLDNIGSNVVQYYTNDFPVEFKKIIPDNSIIAILPLATDDKQSCVFLAFNDDFVFSDGFKEFLQVSFGRIKEISRITDTYHSLENLEARFNGILETVPQSIVFICDSGKNSWLNAPAAKLFKLSPGNVAPAQLSAAMQILRNQADNNEQIFEYGMQLFLSDDKKVTDWKWVFSDPKPLILHVYCTPVKSKSVSGMLWMFEDITLQYLYDKQLNDLNEKLIEISSYKSQFLANMSHELRTPLNSILILANLLGENVSENLTAKQLDYAQIINRSGTDLLTIIDDILDLSKIEAGKMDLIFENEMTATLVNNMADLFTVVSKERNVSFDIIVAGDVPTEIYTDRLRLEQIIKNLLSNAFKFTPAEGSVKLSFSLDPQKENCLLIAVTDTGIGVEEEKLQHIFEAFKQANGSTTRQFGGTGLGLSISKELIWKFGGEIKLQSIFGKGSTFSISLPILSNLVLSKAPDVLEQAFVMALQPSLDFDLSNKRILVAGDDMRNLFAINALLSEYGAIVYTAIDSEDMVQQFYEQEDVELIVFETSILNENGFDGIAKIRKHYPEDALPIIALLNHENEDVVAKYKACGASDYLIKPFNNNDLLKKINICVNTRIS